MGSISRPEPDHIRDVFALVALAADPGGSGARLRELAAKRKALLDAADAARQAEADAFTARKAAQDAAADVERRADEVAARERVAGQKEEHVALERARLNDDRAAHDAAVAAHKRLVADTERRHTARATELAQKHAKADAALTAATAARESAEADRAEAARLKAEADALRARTLAALQALS